MTSWLAERLREHGVWGTAALIAARAWRDGVRPRLPPTRRMAYGGVPTAVEAKLLDRWVPETWVPNGVHDIPDYEATLLAAIRRTVRPGDRVVVVGGGLGVTATVAALQSGPDGRVTVFEGGARGVRDVRTTARLNGVAERVEVHHAVVGADRFVYGRRKGAIVEPDELPDCDVLELDCEGAEVEILRGLALRPRALLIETHGLYGAPTEAVLALARGLGYRAEVAGLAEPRIPDICEAGDIRVVVAERGDGPA